MLDTKKAAKLLAPAYTDLRLGKLLTVAAGNLWQHYDREAQRNPALKDLAKDASKLYDICERMRMEQTKTT